MGFDPVTSGIKVERLNHLSCMDSWYMWLRLFYLNLKRFLMVQKGGRGKPLPIVFDAARNMGYRTSLQCALTHGGATKWDTPTPYHVLLTNFGYGFTTRAL